MTEPILGPEMVWRKSSYSGSSGGECVEVADRTADACVSLRDSKDQSGPTLVFGAGAWMDFVTGVKGEDFPLA